MDFEADHIILATGRASAKYAGFEWGDKRRFLFRSGVNGADLELLDVLENERIVGRFSDLVLVSGDAIFAESVAALGAQGVTVTVVARTEALSRRLRMAASQTIELSYEADPFSEEA